MAAALSVLPPSRFFPAPITPFDTEVAVLRSANLSRRDADVAGMRWIAPEDSPDAPRIVVLTEEVSLPASELSERILGRFRDAWFATSLPAQCSVYVESPAQAQALGESLEAAGLSRNDLSFYGISSDALADGPRLRLDPLVGDDAWREWASVERHILSEAIAPSAFSEALLDRSVQFKRRQQRESPPVRRFVGRSPSGEPIAMIGYAPFASCDLGFAEHGPLVRLRDVGVLPSARGRGTGTALLRALAATSIDECEATQVLICGSGGGIPAALYRSVGARVVGHCVMFSGELIV